MSGRGRDAATTEVATDPVPVVSGAPQAGPTGTTQADSVDVVHCSQSAEPARPPAAAAPDGSPGAERGEPATLAAEGAPRETRERPSAALEALTSAESLEARSWVQAARATAIERFPYLDVALTSMVLVEAAGLGTVATDARWRFYYDPLRVMALESRERLEILVSDWVHEVGHLLRDHSQRWTDLGQPPALHRVFNIAGDALINHDLAELGLTLLPTDVTFERLPPEAEAAHAMTTEEIYQRLRQAVTEGADVLAPHERADQPSACGRADSSSADTTAASDDARDCGSCAGGSRRPWERPIDESDGQPLPNDGSVEPGRAELVRHETAGKVRSHLRTLGAGSTPAALRAWADSILEPLVDWRRELRAAVSRGLSQAAGRTDYSWSQPARRRVPGYTMPGMVAPAPPSVAVVVDTSGSMSPDDLAQCIADIAALTRSVAAPSSSAPVRVAPCDTEVGEIGVVRDRSDIRGLELTGGGGTDMRVGIQTAARLRPTPDVIVILTDGYTPWPAAAPDEAPRARYVAVVVAHDGSSSDIPDWMHVIHSGQAGSWPN